MGTAGVSESLNIKTYPSRDALEQGVTERLVDGLHHALDAKPTVAISLSGGSTPMPIYARLAKASVDWDRVVAIPTDERWVARDHEANNAHQIKQHLKGQGPAIRDLVPQSVDGPPDASFAHQVLQELPSPFAISVVGMGQDAHFASLFPNHAKLLEGLDVHSSSDFISLTPDPLPPEAPFGRISLTLSKLMDSQAILLVITGSQKKAVLDEAWARVSAHDDAQAQWPIMALLREAKDRLEIHWSE